MSIERDENRPDFPKDPRIQRRLEEQILWPLEIMEASDRYDEAKFFAELLADNSLTSELRWGAYRRMARSLMKCKEYLSQAEEHEKKPPKGLRRVWDVLTGDIFW